MNEVNCRNSNGIVQYMYGEMAESAAAEFESHLVGCQTCTDEFAALSAARYEVYDWKKLEFDPLATPAMQIPFEEVSRVSWIERLRAAFSFGWPMPAGALAGLAFLVVVFGTLVVSRKGDDVLVQTSVNTPANRPANTRNADSAPDPSETRNEPNVEPIEPDASAPRRTVIRQSNPRRVVRPQQTNVPRSTTPRSTTAQAPAAPRLNDFVEEEDNSLRLAELFEDIDTSE